MQTVNLLLLVVLILNSGKVHGCSVGENKASGFEIFVSRKKDSIEHGFIKQKVAHPLGNNDVEFFHREFSFFELALDESDSL